MSSFDHGHVMLKLIQINSEAALQVANGVFGGIIWHWHEKGTPEESRSNQLHS